MARIKKLESPGNWGSSDSPEQTKEAIDRALEKGNHESKIIQE